MIAPAAHPQESARLALLHRCGVLDTPAEPDFDGVAALASALAHTPIALVSLIDGHRQWFKAHHGLAATETPRDVAFCAHAILTPEEPFVVEDALADPRFHDNPLATGGPRVVFYAGIPLQVGPEHLPVGTLCVIDHRARRLSAEQLAALRILARQVELLLDLRERQGRLEAALVALDRTRAEAEAARAEAEAARVQAEAALVQRTQFLATVSHEIRTPMNGVVGMASALLDGPDLSPALREDLETICRSGESLVGILNDVLDAAKLEAGKIELEAAPYDARRVAADVVALFRAQAAAKDVAIDLLWSESVPSLVTGDGARFRQVLINLVANAVKFTPRGTVRVRAADDGPDLAIAVQDTGIGIPPERLGRLFERFVQGDGAVGRTYGGTGLGLAICRMLCEAMGGRIGVASAPGAGTTFTMVLPRGSAAAPSAPAAAVAVAVPRRALVADDDAVNRTIARRLLERSGFLVDVVHDGGPAVAAHGAALAAGDPYRLILLDGRMERMGGAAAAQGIRAQEARQGAAPAAIVAFTGSEGDDEQAELLAAGMDAVLVKPVTGEGLRRLVADLRLDPPIPSPPAGA